MPAPNTDSTTLNTTSGLWASSRPLRNVISGWKRDCGASWPSDSSAAATAAAESSVSSSSGGASGATSEWRTRTFMLRSGRDALARLQPRIALEERLQDAADELGMVEPGPRRDQAEVGIVPGAGRRAD